MDKINKLINDQNYFDEYINNIDNNTINIPDNLNDSIYNKINKDKQYKFKVFKFVACTVFALIISQTNLVKTNLINEKIENTISFENKIINFNFSELLKKGGK
ncbi:MAG: hypothetical protein RSE41_11010 [Clostridia bacterium]